MSRATELLQLVKEILMLEDKQPSKKDTAVEDFKKNVGKQPVLRYQSSKLTSQ